MNGFQKVKNFDKKSASLFKILVAHGNMDIVWKIQMPNSTLGQEGVINPGFSGTETPKHDSLPSAPVILPIAGIPAGPHPFHRAQTDTNLLHSSNSTLPVSYLLHHFIIYVMWYNLCTKYVIVGFFSDNYKNGHNEAYVYKRDIKSFGNTHWVTRTWEQVTWEQGKINITVSYLLNG